MHLGLVLGLMFKKSGAIEKEMEVFYEGGRIYFCLKTGDPNNIQVKP